MAAPDPSPVAPTTSPTLPPQATQKQSKKRKRKRATSPTTTTTPTHPTHLSLRHPLWAYLHLQPLGPPTATADVTDAAADAPPLDAVTAHLRLTAALTRFLGAHGAAVSLDVLRLDTAGVWVRVPAADRGAVVAAVGGWVGARGEGWRVRGASWWDARAPRRGAGQELFAD